MGSQVFSCEANTTLAIDEVLDIVAENATDGSAYVFAEAVCALSQLDSVYYAKYKDLRHAVVNRLRSIFAVKDMYRFEPAMYALLQKFVNDVYYVHAEFVEEAEDDADFQWIVATFEELNDSDLETMEEDAANSRDWKTALDKLNALLNLFYSFFHVHAVCAPTRVLL